MTDEHQEVNTDSTSRSTEKIQILELSDADVKINDSYIQEIK